MNTIGKGYIHIYTGNGKGKTTAALGLALRAAGCGLRTCIIQFMKGQHYSELDAVKMLQGLVTIEQYGHPEFCRISNPPDPGDLLRAKTAFDRLVSAINSGEFDIIIADELITSMKFGFIDEADILSFMKNKPQGVELVLTGRGATESLIAAADLVTEMAEIKHYYQNGVQARCGIEN